MYKTVLCNKQKQVFKLLCWLFQHR